MPKYAAKTDVSVAKSRAEIESLVEKYGAGQFVSGRDESRAVIGFSMCGRQIKFLLNLPNKSDDQFTHYRHSSGKKMPRAEGQAEKQWEQACRQRWRALALVIKAKLEAVECGISEFDDEFMANIVMPGGETIGQRMRPQIVSMYENGDVPPMLPDYSQ